MARLYRPHPARPSAFLDESRRVSGRAHRRLRMVLAGVASLLVFAVIAGLVALDQRAKARAEATAAAAQRLGAEALTEDDLDRALLLARQGMALHDSPETQSNLLAALLKSPAAIGVLSGDGDRVTGLDLSPDGRTLAFVDADGTLNRIDTRTRRPMVAPQTVPGHVASGAEDVRFSNDGSLLAIGGLEPQILDARTHRVVSRVRTARLIYGLRFSPDARTLFALVDDFSERSLVQRFDVRSGSPLGVPQVVASGMKTASLLLTRDGRRLVTSLEDGPIEVRDARTLRPLRQLRLSAAAAALSPDERTLLVGGRDGSVRFVDLVTGHARTASGRHDGAVTAAAFSVDGRTAVSGGEDSRAIVWNVGRAAADETLAGHSGVITGVAIGRDGRTLYTAALDGNVVIWISPAAAASEVGSTSGEAFPSDPWAPLSQVTRSAPTAASSL